MGQFRIAAILFISGMLGLFTSNCQKFEPERVIKVKTASYEDITISTCNISGAMVDLGSKGISEHGFYYSLSSDIGNAYPPVSLGAATERGPFSTTLTGLSPGTTYYFWAYAAKGDEKEYGSPLSFTTLSASGPDVETGAIISLTSTYAEIACNVLSDGGSPVTERGICWDSISNPTRDKSHSVHGTGTGEYTGIISGLIPERTYYARAYAINIADTSYGVTREIITPLEVIKPQVSTNDVRDITWSSAVCGGQITSDGGSEILEKGICWSENQLPTLSDMKDSSVITGSDFELSMTDLLPDVQYYVRAYARNSAGIAYGEMKGFRTIEAPIAPTIITLGVGSIGHTTAMSGGIITTDGGAPVHTRGLCLSDTEQKPSLSDIVLEYENDDDHYTIEMNELTHNTTYFVRAFASNDVGTGYGETVEFRTLFLCGSQLVDERDGQTYFTVQIGDQCWMAENLNVGEQLDLSDSQSDNTILEKYCFGDLEQNCDFYGGLYAWDEMMQYTEIESSQGVCPAGWHIPSDYEWKILERALGMSIEQSDSTEWRGTDEGGKLKSGGTSLWNPPNTGATNSSLFSALPAGMVFHDGGSAGLDDFAVFWTSTPILDTQAWYRYLHTDESRIYRVDGFRPNTTSVRCVKD